MNKRLRLDFNIIGIIFIRLYHPTNSRMLGRGKKILTAIWKNNYVINWEEEWIKKHTHRIQQKTIENSIWFFGVQLINRPKERKHNEIFLYRSHSLLLSIFSNELNNFKSITFCAQTRIEITSFIYVAYSVNFNKQKRATTTDPSKTTN